MRIPWVITGIGFSPADLQDAMDGVTLIGERQVRRYRLPPLVLSGIVYERERRRAPLPGVERFQTPVDAWLLGHADCDGLAPYRASELRARGVDARARVIRAPGVGYHVVVVREGVGGHAVIEDPSAELGMLDGVEQDADDPIESAKVRRRRRARAFLSKAVDLAKQAASVASAPQRQALMTASSAHARIASSLYDRDDGSVAQDIEGRLVSCLRRA